MIQPKRMKVAIVGSGISGLSAAWALHQAKAYEVHIYEAADRLGGHTNTVPFVKGSKQTMVDTGFIVMNTATYPNLLSLLDHLQIKTEPTEMTFGVSRNHGAFEWSGTCLSSLFAQRQNVTSLRFWRMIFDIIRFNTFAPDLLSTGDEGEKDITLGAYLDREGYSEVFKQDYLLPMTAAVWSTSPDKCALQLPAVTLVRFMWNHHLLNTTAERPSWLTIKGGAKTYIDAMVRDFPKWQIHLSTPVKKVGTRSDGKPFLQIVEEEAEEEFEYAYDHIIMATHGDQALSLLRETATPKESELLSAFKTSKNSVVLHSDLDHMPALRTTWAAWNYLTRSTPASKNVEKVSLTYNMNILQHISVATFGDVLATLNPLSPPKPELVQGEYEYAHPLYTPTAIAAQKRLDEIQDKRGLSFVGAWTGYGFHEDGCTSGLRAAERLGARVSWGYRRVVDNRRIREGPKLDATRLMLRIVVWALAVLVGWIEAVVGGDEWKRV